MEIELEKLPQWYDQRANELLREFRGDARRLINALNEQAGAVRKAAVELGSVVDRSWGDQNTKDYGGRLSEKILKTLEPLKPPESFTYDQVRTFNEAVVLAIRDVFEASRRYIPRLTKEFKLQVALLDFSLRKLAGASKELDDVLKGRHAKARDVETLAGSIQDMIRQAGDAEKLSEEEARARSEIEALESNRSQLTKALNELKTHQHFAELEKLDVEIERVESDFARFLNPLNKPLRKLEKAVQGGYASLGEFNALLTEFLDDPLETVSVRAPETITAFLEKVERSIQDGKVTVEERKQRKALEAIKWARDGYLQNLRDEYAIVKANREETARLLKAGGLGEREQALASRASKIDNQARDLQVELTRLLQQKERALAALKEQRRRVEESVKKLTKSNVTIKIPGLSSL